MNTHLLEEDLKFRIRTYKSDIEYYDKMILIYKDNNKVESELYSIKSEREKRNLIRVEKCLDLISSLENTFLSEKDIEETREKFKEV